MAKFDNGGINEQQAADNNRSFMRSMRLFCADLGMVARSCGRYHERSARPAEGQGRYFANRNTINIKARQQSEAKDSAQKLQAAETRARDAEAKAREAEAKANEAEAKAQSDTAASEAEIAKVKAQTLTAADMAIPTKMPPGPAVQYVTVLPNCVGIRVGEVDICTKGDISFFGVEHLCISFASRGSRHREDRELAAERGVVAQRGIAAHRA